MGQRVLYGVIAAGLITVLIAQVGHVAVPEGGATPDPARIAAVSRGIDPNTATWVELALLPGLGEVLSKRIVAYREAVRADIGPGKPVFTCLEDLDVIRDIGEGRIARWQGLMVFPEEAIGAGPDH